MPGTFYLAAPFGYGSELVNKRKDLLDRGHYVTSRWIDRASGEKENISEIEAANQDLEDIEDSETLILFTNTGIESKGGKDAEFGYALGLGMDLVVIGPLTHVFTYLVDFVSNFSTWEEFLTTLDMEYGNLRRV